MSLFDFPSFPAVARSACLFARATRLVVSALALLVGVGARAIAQTPALTVSSGSIDGSRGSWVSVPFTIVNNTNSVQSAWVSATCDAVIWNQWDFTDDPADFGECGPNATGVTLTPYASSTISVQVWTGAMSTPGHVTLTASVSTAAWSGTYTLYVPRRPRLSDLVVTPNGGPTTVSPNTTYTLIFSLTNPTAYMMFGEATLDCTVFVMSSCGWYHGTAANLDNKGWYPFQVATTYATGGKATFYTGPPGTHGAIKFITRMPDPATGVMAFDTVTFVVLSGDQLMPTVTPKSVTMKVVPTIARVDTFTVTNSGLVGADYAFAASCGSFGTTGGCVPVPSGATMAPGASVKVAVAYLPSAVNGTTSTIKLVATGTIPGVAAQIDSGSLIVTALDATPPVVVASPVEGSTLSTQRFTATVSVCDDGLLSNPIVTFNGAVLPDMFLRAPRSGCASAGSSTFALAAIPGTNTIRVIANDGYNTDTLTRTFNYDDAGDVVPRIAAMFDPSAYPSVRIPLATAWADTFTVTNPGPVSAVYSLTATCGVFSGCSTPSTVTIRAGESIKIPVAYVSSSTAGQTSTVRLVASHTSVTGHTVSASSYMLDATAGGSVTTMTMSPADGATYTSPSMTLTVTWCDPDDAIVSRAVFVGFQMLSDAFVASSAPGCASGGSSTWSNVALQPWDQAVVAMATDAAGHPSRVSHTVRYVPSLTTYAPQVTPKNTSRVVPQDVVSSQTFMITNSGSAVATYRLTPSCGVYSVCVADKTSVTLAPGARDSTHVSFLAPTLIAAYAPIRLVARYTGTDASSIADSADVMVRTPTAAELFQPKVVGGYDLGVVAPSALISLNFTVRNLGTQSVNYYVVGQTTGGMSFITPPPMRVFVPAGGFVTISSTAGVPEVSGVAASASLVVFYTASDSSVVQSTGTFLLRSGTSAPPVQLAAVAISPHLLQPSTPANADVTQQFVLSSVGAVGSKFVYSIACSGGAICTPHIDSTAVVNPGSSQSVSVRYHTGALGAQGRVVVTAAPNTLLSAIDSGVVSFTVSVVPPITVIVSGLNPGATVPREQCVTIAAGSDAAYECGDLRIAHPLPPTMTMNKTRVPTLIYNSAQARGRGIIAATVSVLPGSAPGFLRATLTLGAGKVFTRDFPWDPSWSDGAPRRISIPFDAVDKTVTTVDHPTGLFNYTLEVRSVSDASMVGQDTGSVVVVDRSSSSFGQGWWLDGLEQLSFVVPVATQRLWIGGDGSARLYTQVADTEWRVLPTMDRPDVLVKVGSSYHRLLPDGAYVEFDGAGKHVATVNAAGHRIQFNYLAAGQLGSIDLPVPVGSVSAHSYIFNYDTQNRLVSADAPRGAAGARHVVVTPVAGTSRAITSIADPGLPAVSFAPDAFGVIATRTNRLGRSTHFGFDSVSHLLTSATVDLQSVDGSPLISTFCAAEGAGLSACASLPVVPGTVRTHYVGPRYDRTDTTDFYLTPFGAPKLIVGAQGNTSTIERNDSNWPLLATAVVDAVGHRIETTYHPTRGLTLSVTDVNRFALAPGGASTRTTSTYVWDATCDEVALITGPMGETQSFSYNHPACTRATQMDGRGASTTTTFSYDGANRLRDIARPITQRTGATEHYEYDGKLGNDSLNRSPLGIVGTTLRDAAGMDSVSIAPIDSLGAFVTTSIVRDAADREVFTRTSGREVWRSGDNHPDYFHSTTIDSVVSHKWYNAESGLDSLTRHMNPSLNGILDLTTRWTYDAAGRKRSETSPDGKVERYVYDQDGVNMSSLVTRNGDQVAMHYDRMNRMVSKHLPSRTVTRALGAITVPAQVDTFTFDAAGRMTSAVNPFATVARTYTVGGMMTDETEQVASASKTFGQHEYHLHFEYDLSGRRRALTYPTGLYSDNVLAYHYNAFGGLQAIDVGAFGGTFGFDYDARQRLTSVLDPSGVLDLHQYDDDDRETAVIQRAPQTQLGWFTDSRDLRDTIRADHIRRDLTGRAIRVDGYDFDMYDMGYNAVGPLAYSWHQNTGFESIGRTVEETFATDVLGNTQQTTSSNPTWSGVDVHTYDARTGRLMSIVPPLGATAPAPSLAAQYDSAGNQVWVVRARSTRALLYPTVPFWLITNTMNVYDAAGHLRFVRQRPDASQTLHAFPEDEYAEEETRYDALGRRVWVQSNHLDPSSGVCGISCSVQRFVWDGDQLLGEFRMPIDAASAENDTRTIVTWQLLPGDGGGPPITGADSVPTYSWTWGAVSYVHGLGIDQPIAVIRQGGGPVGDTLAISPVTFYPHLDWRGNMTSASFKDGRPLLFGSLHATPPLQLEQNIALSAYAASSSPTWAVTNWSGSLLNGQFGESGLQYRRNRYYDPQQGRFTQEDPIGLAGGMNLYGFGGGDPVNFSDPLGLCPIPANDCPPGTFTAIGALGGAILGGSGGGAAGLATGPAAVVASPMAAAAGAMEGAVLGARLGLAIDGGIAVAKADIGGLVDAAKVKYPNKSGREEDHHVTPKYLGGDADGPTVRINASYHQEITNAFRQLWSYGSKQLPTMNELKVIMQTVYSSYPIP